jgi:hypothetical protein
LLPIPVKARVIFGNLDMTHVNIVFPHIVIEITKHILSERKPALRP